MEPEVTKGDPLEGHNFILVSKKNYPKERPETLGLLKRFLDWLARGAVKSNIGRRPCPT
jgi:hypothetical protein